MSAPALSNRKGFSLVEVIVAMTLLSVAMMSLAGAASLGLAQMLKARQDLQYSSDVQQVADSLVSVGWNRVSSGGATIRGRPVSWAVSTISANSQKVDILVQRHGQANSFTVFQDTVTVYLAKSQVQ
ncbi:MAG TPA: prepilin-type N-terminal cleavage/methylation domain-containing protein [Gemmatimonadaceae bacterium]|nr:prepilin-type N-terminal cleavage/methylation domain-containing protein [Gemmatimonadaceae bacterium]